MKEGSDVLDASWLARRPGMHIWLLGTSSPSSPPQILSSDDDNLIKVILGTCQYLRSHFLFSLPIRDRQNAETDQVDREPDDRDFESQV